MVKIEYSPNSCASCQSCRHKILYGQIRVCVKAASEYCGRSGGRFGRYGGGGIAFINKYHHANCYSNRRDFTTFYGFFELIQEDQKRFMSAAQIHERFGPEDDGKEDEAKSGVDVAATSSAAGTPTSATLVSADNVIKGEDSNPVAQDAKGGPSTSTDGPGKETKDDFGHERTLTVTGLKYAAIAAAPGQKVVVVREPENVSCYFRTSSLCLVSKPIPPFFNTACVIVGSCDPSYLFLFTKIFSRNTMQMPSG